MAAAAGDAAAGSHSAWLKSELQPLVQAMLKRYARNGITAQASQHARQCLKEAAVKAVLERHEVAEEALQVLWKYACYNGIQHIKTNVPQTMADTLPPLLYESAGCLISLLQELQRRSAISLPAVLGKPLPSSEAVPPALAVQEPSTQYPPLLARRLCSTILTFLVDLERYWLQMDDLPPADVEEHDGTARRYARAALQAWPANGHAWHKLALLQREKRNMSFFYYLVQSAASKEPFPTAEKELLSQLSKVPEAPLPRVHHEDLPLADSELLVSAVEARLVNLLRWAGKASAAAADEQQWLGEIEFLLQQADQVLWPRHLFLYFFTVASWGLMRPSLEPAALDAGVLAYARVATAVAAILSRLWARAFGGTGDQSLANNAAEAAAAPSAAAPQQMALCQPPLLGLLGVLLFLQSTPAATELLQRRQLREHCKVFWAAVRDTVGGLRATVGDVRLPDDTVPGDTGHDRSVLQDLSKAVDLERLQLSSIFRFYGLKKDTGESLSALPGKLDIDPQQHPASASAGDQERWLMNAGKLAVALHRLCPASRPGGPLALPAADVNLMRRMARLKLTADVAAHEAAVEAAPSLLPPILVVDAVTLLQRLKWCQSRAKPLPHPSRLVVVDTTLSLLDWAKSGRPLSTFPGRQAAAGTAGAPGPPTTSVDPVDGFADTARRQQAARAAIGYLDYASRQKSGLVTLETAAAATTSDRRSHPTEAEQMVNTARAIAQRDGRHVVGIVSDDAEIIAAATAAGLKIIRTVHLLPESANTE